MGRVELEVSWEFSHCLDGLRLRDRLETERVKCNCVAGLFELHVWIPHEVPFLLIRGQELLSLLLFAVARLDVVLDFEVLQVEFNADHALSRRMEGLSDRDRSVAFGCDTEHYNRKEDAYRCLGGARDR